MSSSSNASYEEWKRELLSMPPRSILYSLEPIGVGTALVEGLTSYVTRLAEAHCVFPGILVSKFVAPFVQQSPSYKGCWQGMSSGNGRQSYALNALHQQAASAVQVLETLTRQHSLRFLTLLTWAEVFASLGLMRQARAWCPVCLEEWRTTGQVIYEPLLWTLRAVTLCVRHECMLHTCCPYAGCEREIPWLAWRGLAGFCPFCRQWLGTPCPVSGEVDGATMRWQQWVTDQFGTVLALAPTVETPPPSARIHQVLMHFCQQMSQGRMRPFARSLGLPWATVATWMYRREIPQLETLLSLCALWGVSLRACLLDQGTALSFHPAMEGSRPRKDKPQAAAPGTWSTPQVRQTLEAILTTDEDPPPSLKQVAKLLGCAPRSLSKHHPELCRAISARYLAAIQERKQVTLQQRCEEVRQAARQLAAQGKRPTRKKLAEVLTQPGMLRSPEIREAGRTVLQEIDGARDAAVSNERRVSFAEGNIPKTQSVAGMANVRD